MPTPTEPEPEPEAEDFNKILEWTEEEEEAFLNMLEKQDKDKQKE